MVSRKTAVGRLAQWLARLVYTKLRSFLPIGSLRVSAYNPSVLPMHLFVEVCPTVPRKGRSLSPGVTNGGDKSTAFPTAFSFALPFPRPPLAVDSGGSLPLDKVCYR